MTTNKEKVQPIKWFAAKTKFSAEKKIKQFLERLGIEHYIPFRTVIKEKGGKKVKVEKPVIPAQFENLGELVKNTIFVA